MQERIQKVLAAAGLGSRRQIESWIKEGRLKINGQKVELGTRISVDGSEHITLDGKPIRRHQKKVVPRIIAYHKPVGEVCSRHDPEGRPTIFKNLPKLDTGRWVSVGRLDINTSGLVLLTTDGELANRLMHPSYTVEREYSVRVLGNVSEDQLEQLAHGVQLEDGPARFEDIVDAGGEGANHWYYVLLAEGRNREVRRLWEAVGVQVSRLIRVRYGPVFLEPRIKTGHWEELKPDVTKSLYQMVNMKPPGLPKNELIAKRHNEKKRSLGKSSRRPKR